MAGLSAGWRASGLGAGDSVRGFFEFRRRKSGVTFYRGEPVMAQQILDLFEIAASFHDSHSKGVT